MSIDKNTGISTTLFEAPCLAKVISHLDTTYMGSLEVQLLRPGAGNDSSGGQVQQVKYMSPFWGSTSIDHVSSINDYENTQKSYGLWMVPPDVGSTVIVIFINGDPARGYWIGCVPDESMNFMVPGIAATENIVGSTDADKAGRNGRVPVAEYNKIENSNLSTGDPTSFKKPIHPLKYVLERQGLLLDDIRGITSSSARRETPSMVFGFSTPGPFDKQSTAKHGKIGKSDSAIINAPVSHLGGSSFVMDDGDDKFIRKTSAGDGPPEYASVVNSDTAGDNTIPHNELIRIRTRTGHQILLHNSEDLIYIGNASGTSWIELTSNGKIDIFADDSISIRTKQDLNITADRDINLNAGRNINLVSGSGVKIGAGTNFDITALSNGNITIAGNSNLKVGGEHIVSATKFHVNGKQAANASAAAIPRRVPDAEPWAGHENLDPKEYTADKTAAYVVDPEHPYVPHMPSSFGKYSTTTDTFNKN